MVRKICISALAIYDIRNGRAARYSRKNVLSIAVVDKSQDRNQWASLIGNRPNAL